MKKLLLLLIPVLLLSFCALSVAEESEEMEWTIMFYLCGSDLESKYSYGLTNIEDILGCYPFFNFYETSPEETDRFADHELDVNIVFETGGCKEWHGDLGIDSQSLQRWRYEVDPGGWKNKLVLEQTLPLQSMADPETLSDFVRWSVSNYPAKKYLLVLWDHGGGSKTGLFLDELFGGDFMNLKELGEALRSSGVHLDLVLFDACMMGNLETAYAIRDSADWMVASEEVVAGRGTAINKWLQELIYTPNRTAEELGRLICEKTLVWYAQEESELFSDLLTWSVLDLSKIETMVSLFDQLFKDMGKIYATAPTQMVLQARAMLEGEIFGTKEDGPLDLGSIFYHFEEYWNPRLRREILSCLNSVVTHCVRGYGRSAASGLSFCYAFDFDLKELDVYSNNCPSPHYLALLDAISPWTAPDWVYEKAERLPEIETLDAYRIIVEKQLNPRGVPSFQLGFTETVYGTNCEYRLYKKEKRGNVSCLGTMPVRDEIWVISEEILDENDFWIGYTVKEPWLWPALEGKTCSFHAMRSTTSSTYEYNSTIPIQVNGEICDLRCKYDLHQQTYTVHGVWSGYTWDDEMFDRNVKSLSQMSGLEYRLLFPVMNDTFQITKYIGDQTGTIYRSMEVANQPLAPGTYYLEYVVYDIFLRPYVMNRFEMVWDGKKATFPDSEKWPEIIEMQISENYW